MSDGKIVIDTALDTKEIVKDINNLKSSLGNIDVSRLASQMNNLNNILNNTGKSIESQKAKLTELRTAFNNSTDVGQRNQMRDQIRATETEITHLERVFTDLGLTINSINSDVNFGSARREISDLADEFRSADVRISDTLDDISSNSDEMADNIRENNNKASKSFKDFGTEISKAGEKATGAGEKLENGLTKPILAAGAGLLAIGVTTDEALSKIRSQLGTTAAETEKLKKVALDVYQNGYGESLEDVSEGLVSLQQNLKSTANMTDETKEKLLTNSLTMQNLFDVDPKELTAALSVMQNSGFDDDIEHAMDVVAYGFQNGANYSDELIDTLKEYSPQFVKLGLDSETAMNYLVTGANNGAFSLDKVADAMKEFSIRAIDGSTTTVDGFTKLNMNADEMAKKFAKGGDTSKQALQDVLTGLRNMKDPVAQSVAGVDLFGTMWEDLGPQVMNAMADVKGGINSINGTMDEATKNNTSAANDFESTLRKTRVALLPLATEVMNMVREVLPELTEGIKAVSGVLNGMDSGTKQTVIKMAMLAAGIGPVVGIIGKVTSLGGKFVTFLGGLGEASATAGGGTAGLVTALTGIGPVGWAALASVAALGVGVAGFATHAELMSKSVDTSAESLSTWEQLVNTLTGSTIKSKAELQKAGLIYKDFGEGVSDSFKDGIQKATEEYHNFQILLNQSNIGDKITEANQGKISTAINKIIDEAKKVINDRKGELQKDLIAGMTADGTGIEENEQTVLDIVGKSSDEKLSKVTEIQGKITETWNNAIKDHGKLSEEDVKTIQNYMKEIERIKMEASAKNTAESTFTENSFNERLDGLSAEDAKKEYADTSKTIHDNYSNLKATYKTENDSLALQLKQSQTDLNKAQTEEQSNKAKADIVAIQQEIDDKNNKYDQAISEEKGKRRKLLDMMYEKNPTLKNNFNEIDGSMFSKDDFTAQTKLKDIESTYTEVAESTKSGIKHVQDSIGGWHDIYVAVDESTGNITSAFDVNAREGETAIGGYSAKFETAAKEAAEKAKASASKLAEAFQMNLPSLTGINGKASKIQLQGDSLINIDTGATLSQFDTIITKADETKVAITNINGAQVKIEFNKDGTIKNAKDVLNAINKVASSPAKVNIDVDDKEAVERFKQLEDLKDKFQGQELKEKVTIEGEDFSKVDDIINKLEKMPKDSKINLKINGEEVKTIDEAINALKKVPPETETEIKVENSDATEKIEETETKADDLDNKSPTVTANADNSDANGKIDETGDKTTTLDGQSAEITVTADTSQADTNVSTFWEWWSKILNSDSVVTKTVKAVQESNTTSEFFGNLFKPTKSYTGSSIGDTGLTTAHEHGWEINTGEEALYLMGGGSSIADHMTSKNEMERDVDSSVNSKVGNVVNTLVTNLARQNGILSQVAKNTGDTATNSKDTAESLLVGINNSTSGSFTGLKSEIDATNTEKDRTSNLKVENYAYYGIAKQNLDDLNGQIDDLKNKSQDLTDNLGENATESAKKAVEVSKKEIETQQHVLEKKKDIAQQEENIAKEAAQSEIESAKNAAEQQVKIAEEKKEKLTKLAEAVTEAIKNQLTEEKAAAEKVLNDDLKDLEESYNKRVAKVEKSAKSKSDSIDKKIKSLEEETTDTSREDERKSDNDNISSLTTKMNNTASFADKRSLALQIKNAQAELDKKEKSWDTEDEKAELEEEKTKLSEREENQKKTLEKEYNKKKEAKEKELKATDEYYDKLLSTDALNAQTRYTMLNSNSQNLVTLLNSYNPDWQDAGQSLGDSLLTGLNSSKQSVEDAVSEMVSLRGGSQSPPHAINSDTGEYEGYASGTSSNPSAGLYYTNENGPEMSTNGDVAYVSKGAAIKNRMQTDQFIKSEISKQVGLMKSSVLSEQANMQALLTGNLAKSSSNNITNNATNNNAPLFHAEHVHFNNENDIEQMAYKLGFYNTRNKTN